MTAVNYANAIDLFDRAYRLQVDTLVVTGLQVKFTVKRSLAVKTPNSAHIEIANLSETTRKRLQGMRDVFVTLEAGYARGTSVIFRGDLSEVWSSREGTEWMTTVESGDGLKSRKQKRLNKSYPAGTPISKLLGECARALGVGLGNVDKQGPLAELFNAEPPKRMGGGAITGDAVAQLDRVCRSCGLEWSIQDNQLQVLALDSSLQEMGPNLSDASGMIGSPEVGKNGITRVRTLMVPNLQPGRKIELDSLLVQGIFRIETAHYIGDFEGSEWGAELELLPIK